MAVDLRPLAQVKAATGQAPAFPLVRAETVPALGLDLTEDAAARSLYVVDASFVLRAALHYPAAVGWSSFELLRVVDGLRRADAGVCTPANWVAGRDAFVAGDDADAALALFPKGVRAVEVPSGACVALTPDPCSDVEDGGGDAG